MGRGFEPHRGHRNKVRRFDTERQKMTTPTVSTYCRSFFFVLSLAGYTKISNKKQFLVDKSWTRILGENLSTDFSSFVFIFPHLVYRKYFIYR